MHGRSGAPARLSVDIACGAIRLVVEHVADYDLGPLTDEQPRLGGALSARAPGDQSKLAFEPIHGDVPTSCAQN
jgi:hypothetical protein